MTARKQFPGTGPAACCQPFKRLQFRQHRPRHIVTTAKKAATRTRSILLQLTLATFIALAAGVGSTTELGIEGTQFTLNGKPTFLYGISYYGGLGASEEFVRRDFDDIQRNGFNWIRVWATWAAFETDLAAVDVNDGKPRQPFFDRLKWLIAECDRRGMAVDITLGKGDGAPVNRLDSQQKHRRVAATLVTHLKPFRNWYLDLSNERNIRDKRHTSIEELKQLREDVKGADPLRLVTASSGTDIRHDELRDYLERAQLDFVCPHRGRSPKSPGETEENARKLLSWMKEFGRVVPVHYQEPFRRGYTDWEPKVGDFVTDVLGAKAGGAAGWCFHNGSEKRGPEGQPRRSFDLRAKRLFDQLDPEERKAIERLTETFVGAGK